MNWLQKIASNKGWFGQLTTAFKNNPHPEIGLLVGNNMFAPNEDRPIFYHNSALSFHFFNKENSLFIGIHFQPIIGGEVKIDIFVSTDEGIIGRANISFSPSLFDMQKICNQVVLEAYKIIDKELEFSKTMGIEKGW